MNTIKIRQYTPPQLEAFDNEDNFIGYINHYVELQRLLEDIRNTQTKGYYVKYSSNKILISNDGKIGVDNIIMLQDLFNIQQHESTQC